MAVPSPQLPLRAKYTYSPYFNPLSKKQLFYILDKQQKFSRDQLTVIKITSCLFYLWTKQQKSLTRNGSGEVLLILTCHNKSWPLTSDIPTLNRKAVTHNWLLITCPFDRLAGKPVAQITRWPQIYISFKDLKNIFSHKTGSHAKRTMQPDL